MIGCNWKYQPECENKPPQQKTAAKTAEAGQLCQVEMLVGLKAGVVEELRLKV